MTGSSGLRWASDLKRLEARLTNPGSWLPASAWKQPKVRAYVPSRFEVCAAAVAVPDLDKPAQVRDVRMGPARIVALLPAAAQKVLRGRDWRTEVSRGPGVAPGVPGAVRRGVYGGCFAVTTNEARSLAKALDGAGPADARKGGGINLHYQFDAPGPSRQVWIGFSPFLPHGETTCLGVRMSSRVLLRGVRMKARVVALVALAAAVTLTSVAAAGPAAAKQRVGIDMKLYPQKAFVFTPLQAGPLKSDSGTISHNFLSILGRGVMRDGQKVTIYDGGVATLTGKRGTLTIRNRNEWVDFDATGMATVRTTPSPSEPGRSYAEPASTPGSPGRGGVAI